MRKCKYVCMRFFLQKTLLADFSTGAKTGVEEFVEAVLGNYQVVALEHDYAIRITLEDSGVFFGKLSKRRLTETHSLTPEDVVEQDIEDWPFVEFLCDPYKNQVIVLRLKSDIMADATNAKRVLADIFSKRLEKTGYGATVEPLSVKRAFWSVVEASDKLYSVALSLHSPNLFGADSKANLALKEIQDIFNNDEFYVKIENKDGQLSLPEQNLASYVEYAEQGGGSWRAKVEREGRIETVSSGQLTQEVYVSQKVDDQQERLRIAHEDFRPYITLPNAQD